MSDAVFTLWMILTFTLGTVVATLIIWNPERAFSVASRCIRLIVQRTPQGWPRRVSWWTWRPHFPHVHLWRSRTVSIPGPQRTTIHGALEKSCRCGERTFIPDLSNLMASNERLAGELQRLRSRMDTGVMVSSRAELSARERVCRNAAMDAIPNAVCGRCGVPHRMLSPAGQRRST